MQSSVVMKIFFNFCLTISLGRSLASIIQSDALKTFTQGDKVHLQCLVSRESAHYYNWFKLTGENVPVMIISIFARANISKSFGEFDDPRFAAEKNGDIFMLNISDARESDTGMYYCATWYFLTMTFGKGVFLKYDGADKGTQNLIQQSVSESVQPGDSVTLNCTIHTKTCAGEHSVYWFRHGSGQSHPGIIYTNGDRSGQCKKSPEAGSPTQSCVYNLPKRNLSLSDAGTYYCAVSSCGEILFGNGTKLDIQGTFPANWDDPRLLTLIVSNILSFIIIVVLICWRWMRYSVSSQGSPKQFQRDVTAPSCPENEKENGEEQTYAAMDFPVKKTKRRTQPVRLTRETGEPVVYSAVTYRRQDFE